MSLLFLQVFVVCLALQRSNAYNLDVHNARIFSDPKPSGRSSYFGYSVALYKGLDTSLMIVGAPRANSSGPANLRNGVIEYGAVYKCYVDKENCIEWIVNDDSPSYEENIKQFKNYSWLGATVVVENVPDPRVVVCAPRWKLKFHSSNIDKLYMHGMCYSVIAKDSSMISDDDSLIKHYPLKDIDRQLIRDTKDYSIKEDGYKFYYGVGQSGFSAHITPDSHYLTLGAPGVLSWTGTTIIIKDSQTDVVEVGNSHLQKYNLFGYSITSGNFYDKNERLYASGAPRAAGVFGEVLIFTSKNDIFEPILNISHIIKGEQLGEYFGSSLSSCDLNNDGKDELIVGAPLWTHYTEEGRVKVYVSRGQSLYVAERINGNYPSGRFGTSISCLGDLNQDGFHDLAIGAPYESNGAVYIFNGNARGILGQPSQRITALELSPTLRGFGLSLSEPARDVNGDGYIDLAVGAYGSSQAVLLTGKTVVNASIALSHLNATLDTMFVKSTYFTINVCANYDGLIVPDTFKVKLIVKIDKFHEQASIYRDGNRIGNTCEISDILKKGQRKCTPLEINLKEIVVDMMQIVASLHNGEKPSCSTCPVINPTSKTVDDLKLFSVLDCGVDNICHSDLQLSITSSLDSSNNSYVIGSKSNVNMTISVNNTKEPAYRARVKISIPEPITLARVPLECNKESQVNETSEIVCNLGNPLWHNYKIALEFDMSSIQYSSTINYWYHEIMISVTTTSKEEDTSNNNKLFKINYIKLIDDADLIIAGKSEEDQYSYLVNEIIETTPKSFTFHHIYEVRKIGLTPIEKAAVLVNFPVRFRNVEIARLNHTRSFMNNHKYNCEIDETPSSLLGGRYNYGLSDKTNHSNLISMGKQLILSCNDSKVTCQKLRCDISPISETTSVTTFIITINFRISNFQNEIIAGKDIVYVSQAYGIIIKPDIKTENAKQISTLFIHRKNQNPEGVSTWIIFLSVLLGLAVLIIISLVLFKLGFFVRKRRDGLKHPD